MQVERILMKEFEGIENCNSDVRAAIINFGYNLCLGDLDLAFSFISSIQRFLLYAYYTTFMSNIYNLITFVFYILCSPAVWTSLAKMCVKTKRLDVAEICLGHMKDCRGLAILRAQNKEQELETRVACLAVHLGMYVSVNSTLPIF